MESTFHKLFIDLMVSGAGGGDESTTKICAEDWPLIQPSQVNVALPPVHTAESMLTPLGNSLNYALY